MTISLETQAPPEANPDPTTDPDVPGPSNPDVPDFDDPALDPSFPEVVPGAEPEAEPVSQG